MNETDLINIHTHKECDKPVKCIINLFAHLPVGEMLNDKNFYSIGLHPWHINDDILPYYKKTILDSLVHPNIIAIGEAGLDRAVDIPFKTQTDVFKEHVRISEEKGLPLIIHCVKSYNDLINIYKEFNPVNPWIFHAYNGSVQTTEQLLKHNFYFSFGKSILNPSGKLLSSIQIIPKEKLFVENDDSDIDITKIYSSLAEHLIISQAELKSTINSNFKKCFGLNP